MMGNMGYNTSDGWKSSEVDVNIITELLPSLTAPSLKVFSLYVDADTPIIIMDGSKERTVFVTSKLGMNYMDMFKPIKSIKFVNPGVNYFIAYGI